MKILVDTVGFDEMKRPSLFVQETEGEAPVSEWMPPLNVRGWILEVASWTVMWVIDRGRPYIYVSRKAEDKCPAYKEQVFRLRDDDLRSTLVLESQPGYVKASLLRNNHSAYLYEKYGIERIVSTGDLCHIYAPTRSESRQQHNRHIFSDGQVRSVCGGGQSCYVGGNPTWVMCWYEDQQGCGKSIMYTALPHAEIPMALETYLRKHGAENFKGAAWSDDFDRCFRI